MEALSTCAKQCEVHITELLQQDNDDHILLNHMTDAVARPIEVKMLWRSDRIRYSICTMVTRPEQILRDGRVIP